VWAELYSTCVHQGRTSEAAFAVAPHVAAAARSAEFEERVDFIVFLAAIASSLQERLVPAELSEDYDEALQSARKMVLELVMDQKVALSDLPFVFEALAALHGLPVLARIVGQLANLEFGFVCTECQSDLWVSAATVPFQVYSADPTRNQAAIYRSIHAPDNPAKPSAIVPSQGKDALPWLIWLANRQKADVFRQKLTNLYGRGTCPKCGHDFSLYEQLELAVSS